MSRSLLRRNGRGGNTGALATGYIGAGFASRRALALRLAAVSLGLGSIARLAGASDDGDRSTTSGDGLVHSAEAIHQEVAFKAPRQRVYAALTDSKQFDAVTRLSDAVRLVTAPGAKATSISHEVGGEFTLFGGYITGRHLELIPGERLVQAWRAAGWKPGEYSIVEFEFANDGKGSKLSFDHRGFPDGNGSHLADGWHVHYWEPLAKYLSTS
jgi:uncharacterized protein YndB with AHSA1/START domain